MVSPQIWLILVRKKYILKFLYIALLKTSCIILSYLASCKPEIIFQVDSHSKKSTCSSSQGSAQLTFFDHSLLRDSRRNRTTIVNGYRSRAFSSALLLVPPAAARRISLLLMPHGQLLAAANPPALGRSSGSGSVLQLQDMGRSWTLFGQVTLLEKSGSFSMIVWFDLLFCIFLLEIGHLPDYETYIFPKFRAAFERKIFCERS